MVGIGTPCWFIIRRSLISPHIPAFPHTPGKQFNARRQTARLNDLDHFIRFPAVFSFHGTDQVNLRSSRSKRSIGGTFFLNSKQNQFCYISKIKTYASAIRASIFSHFFPDQITFIFKPPCAHHFQSFWQKCIGDPQIQMGFFPCDFGNRQRFDFFQCHCFIAHQPPVFRRNFSCTVLKLPWRVGINRVIFFLLCKSTKTIQSRLHISHILLRTPS